MNRSALRSSEKLRLWLSGESKKAGGRKMLTGTYFIKRRIGRRISEKKLRADSVPLMRLGPMFEFYCRLFSAPRSSDCFQYT